MESLPRDKGFSCLNLSTFLHSRTLAFAGLSVLVVLGWFYLGLMVRQMIPLMDMSEAGPGMWVFNQFSQWVHLDDFGRALLLSLCGPGLLAVTGADLTGFESVGFLTVMWSAMALAMMLPTAVPMISAYSEICETAAAKSIATVSPGVLIAGYTSVWLGFALVAALAQTGLIYLSLLSPAMVTTHQGVAALLLLSAGLYQFSTLKNSCLSKCRTPLNFFIVNWSFQISDIFKLGVKQGAFCIGCCWALMLVMFVAGVMNVIWMVLLSILMVAEKTIRQSNLLKILSGLFFIAWGILLGLNAFV